jgi:integrase
MKLGRNPNIAKKNEIAAVIDARTRAKLTFGFAMERDASNKMAKDAKGTAKDRCDVRKWIKGMEIWRMPLHDVSKESLQKMMQDVGAERGAPSSVKVWRYARAAWKRLPAGEIPPVDPFAEWLKAHTLPVIKRRQSTLSIDEKQGREWLRAIAALRNTEGSRAFAHRVMADYIILTLCWGARRSEAAALKVENIDFEREYVVFRDTKNGTDHFFPLTPGCAAILRGRIKDNEAPRGIDVKKAKKGEEYYLPDWAFPSRIRGKHLAEPAGALAIGEGASGLAIDMHDLRRSFAGDVAADVMVGADGKATGSFGLVKVAMNHSDMQNDVTQGYIPVTPRLKMLRPVYLAQEQRVFAAAGLDHLLPKQENAEMDMGALLAAIKEKAADPQALQALRKALEI